MAYIYDLADVWASSGTTFTAIKMNVTDTASAAASLLMDLQVGGSSRFRVTKNGDAEVSSGAYYGDSAGTNLRILAAASNPSVVVGGSGTGFIGWANTNIQTPDIFLRRDAANTLAQRNGVNAQAFNLYNTFTDASNYERGFMRWSSNVLQIGSEAAGTGTNRVVQIRAGGSSWSFDPNAATAIPGTLRFAGAYTFSTASGVCTLANESQTGGATFELREQTAPAAPVADRVRIYAEDDGAGKTRLMARFATGAAVQIAIEP